MASAFVDAMRIEPGAAPKLSGRDPGARPDGLKKSEGLDRLAELTGRLEVLHDRLWAEATRAVLARAPGRRRLGQGRDDQARAHGREPAGLPDRLVQGSERDRARTRLPLARARGLPAARRARDLQPVALRGRDRGARAQARAQERSGASGTRTSGSSSGCSSTRARTSSRSASTSRRRSRASGSRSGSTTPEKRWKFRLGDLDDRKLWDEFTAAYEDTIRETSTEWAPWHVVPADHNWVRNLSVAEILVDAFERLDPQFPPADPQLDGVKVT